MHYKDLTKQMLEDLKKINTRLKDTQDTLLSEAIKLDQVLKLRVADDNDILDDYEIELQIDFYLKEDDESYIEDEDNIVSSVHESLKNISIDIENNEWRWCANHNEDRGRPEHPMHQEHHCWWFHSLHSHNHIEYKDMLRIGVIWSDIHVYYKYIK